MLHLLAIKPVFDVEALEPIRNGGLYIIDPETQKVRNPVDPGEWFCRQVVFVCNLPPIERPPRDGGNHYIINAGEKCHCWNAHITI